MTICRHIKILLCWVVITPCLSPAQPDSIAISRTEFLTDQLELIAEQKDGRGDYSDLLEDYLYYSNNPINLNGDQLDKLVELKLINPIQKNNINAYIYKYGQFMSVYELTNVPGIDDPTFDKLLPFVVADKANKKKVITARSILKESRHQFLMRYSQILEPSEGYLIPKDSAHHHRGRAYLGSPQSYYIRYAHKYRDKFRLGFTAEKDAGEIFLKNQLPDTIRILVGDKATNIFDFFSAYAGISNAAILKMAILGDYHLEFGQGLTLWTGMSFGKSVDGTMVERYGRGLRPNTATNENRYFRGAAVSLGWKSLSLTTFFSKNQVDATMGEANESQSDGFASFQESGKHRTVNELLNRDALGISSYGGRLGLSIKNFQIGAIAYETSLGAPKMESEEVYQHFSFHDDHLLNYGLDYKLSFNRVHLFGEVAGSNPGGYAGLAGCNLYLHDRVSLTLLYRYLARGYLNLFNNPFAETSSANNEMGLYLGFRLLISKHLSLNGYVDQVTFPWLRYRVDAPSRSSDYHFQINYTRSRLVSLYARFRYRSKQENNNPLVSFTARVSDVNRMDLRFHITYNPYPWFILKNRLDYVRYDKAEDQHHGYLLYQDILIRHPVFPLQVSFRYMLFSSEGHESRMYCYENDVLYAFSVPSFSGNGQRIFLMLRYKIADWMFLWLRMARTIYSDRRTIGSGGDEIRGPQKTDVKLQLLLKF